MMSHYYKNEPEAFIEAADVLKSIAHPQRLCIVKTLCEKDQINVGDIQHCLNEAQSTVSQHLAKLKAAHIISGKREGTNIYYSISDPRVKQIVQAVIGEFFTDSI